MPDQKPKLVIISGYFNPIHAGHMDMIDAGNSAGDKLVVIVNNDAQQLIKKGKVILNEADRHRIVQSLTQVDEAIVSIDQDGTVIESIRSIAERHPDHQIIFGNGGDRASVNDIPETGVCNEHDIELMFGMGGQDKRDSSTRINDINGTDKINKEKKLIAFDLDGTLTESKSAITDSMSELIEDLLRHKIVCVISGGNFPQFKKQLIDNLNIEPDLLANLHLMPTCGTKYYKFVNKEWNREYSEDIPRKDIDKIIQVVESSAKELGLYEDDAWGDIIEDRGSQITFSALGQEAPSDKKHEWDKDGKKKSALRDMVSARLPDYEVRTGGTTSIDITLPGVDKAYGIGKLLESLSLSKEEMLFVGDALYEGGNDYPVKAMGVDVIEVDSVSQTEGIVRAVNITNP